MDSIAAGFGWSLPHELRVWYRWHDGADPAKRRSIGPVGYELLTLQEALEATAQNRAAFADAAPLVWPREWLVFTTRGRSGCIWTPPPPTAHRALQRRLVWFRGCRRT